MSLFNLTLENLDETENVVSVDETNETEEVKTVFDELAEKNKEGINEYHNFIPEDTPDDEKEQLDKIYNTIDSLESVYVKLIDLEEHDIALTKEDLDVLSERISFAYDKNGLIEDMPLSISQEGYATLLDSNLALEGIKDDLMKRFKALANTSNNIFTRLIEKIKGIFQHESTKMENISKRAQALLNEINEADDFFGGSEVSIGGPGSAITINQQEDCSGILDTIENIVSSYLNESKFLNSYLQDIKECTERVAKSDYNNAEQVKEYMKEACEGLFIPPKEFERWDGDSVGEDYDSYICRISDRYQFTLNMPNGSGGLTPKKSRFIKNTSRDDLHMQIKACNKREAVAILERIINVSDQITKKAQLKETALRVKLELHNLAKNSTLGKKIKEDVRKIADQSTIAKVINFLKNISISLELLTFFKMIYYGGSGILLPVVSTGMAIGYYTLMAKIFRGINAAFIVNLPNIIVQFCMSLFTSAYQAINHTFISLINFVDASRRV